MTRESGGRSARRSSSTLRRRLAAASRRRRSSLRIAGPAMGDRAGGGKKGSNVSFIKPDLPKFLQAAQFQEAGVNDTGIEAALKRRRDDAEKEERSDNEEERPLVVDELEAMTSKERRKAGAGPSSSLFKKSADEPERPGDRFKASAHDAVLAQLARDEATAAAAAPEPAAVVGAPAPAVVFKSKGASVAEAVGAAGVRITKMLSFDADDEGGGIARNTGFPKSRNGLRLESYAGAVAARASWPSVAGSPRIAQPSKSDGVGSFIAAVFGGGARNLWLNSAARASRSSAG